MLYRTIAIIVFPIGIPAGMIMSLYMLGVPNIAKQKIDAACVHAMIILYKDRTAMSQRLASLIGETGQNKVSPWIEDASFRMAVHELGVCRMKCGGEFYNFFLALFPNFDETSNVPIDEITNIHGTGLLQETDTRLLRALLQECDSNGDGW